MQTLQMAIDKAEKAHLFVAQAKGKQVWSVEAQAESKERGYLCCHLVWYDLQADKWNCGCKARCENCIHLGAVILFDRAKRAAAANVKPMRATFVGSQGMRVTR